MQCTREHVGITPTLALDLTFFPLRSPGDCVRSTPVVGCISRFLPGAELRNCMHACIHSLLDLLAKALMTNREEPGDAGLIVS